MGEIKLDLAHVFGLAMVKYVKAERKYGDYDPATDPRDLLDEAEEELLDAINYLAMQVIKLREIKANII